jgi:hypothetical protein
VEPDCLDALARLNKKARRDNDWISATALSAAIRQAKQLDRLIEVLHEIQALPCLDGTVGLACWIENCPRCIARKALEKLKKD